MKIVENSVNDQLTEELLLRSVIDGEFRSEFFSIALSTLPTPVVPQDMSFAEMVKNANNAGCSMTCISGLTINCDQSVTLCCRNTCSTGYTIRCDGTTV